MNKKGKGSLNERRTMKWLEERGFQTTRSGASLGVFDVIGIGARRAVLVQVKSNRWEGLTERKAIEEFSCNRNSFLKCTFRWDDYKKIPKIKVFYYIEWLVLDEDEFEDWFNDNEDL